MSQTLPEDPKGFHVADYVLFACTIAICLGIGVYQAFTGGKQRTTKEYLMADRKLKTLPVAVSMFMSFVSAIIVLGNTAEMYTRGTQLWMMMIGATLGCVLGAQIFVPLFFPLKLTSSFEYLDARFQSRPLHLTAVFLLILNQIFYMGLAMFSPATALEGVTKFPVWASILLSGIVATIYTTMGGMKAVIWTDVFQCAVMLVGVISVLIVGCMRVGGLARVWQLADEGGRLIFFDMNPDPFVRLSFWSVAVGRTISSIFMVGVQQASVQRYCALPTMKEAKASLYWNIPMAVGIMTITCLSGLTVYAYFTELGCDPVRMGFIKSNQLLPYFIMTVINIPGLPGLFLAVLFSGALSSLSSSLSSLSAVTWKDLMEGRFKNLREGHKAFITKMLVLVYGILAMLVGLLCQILSGHVLQASQSLVGGVAAPLSGIFFLAACIPWANWKGCLAGTVVGFVLPMWINIGAYSSQAHRGTLPTPVHNCTLAPNTTAPPIIVDRDDVFILYKLSFMWVPVVGTVSCILVGALVSLCTGPTKPRDLDPKLISPLFDRLCCCLPERLRKHCRCGVEFLPVEDDDGKTEDQDHVSTQPPATPDFTHQKAAVCTLNTNDDRNQIWTTGSEKVNPTYTAGEYEIRGRTNYGFEKDTLANDMFTRL